MKKLTDRQVQVAQFIEGYIEKQGFAPSVRDIADYFGFSPKAAYDHMTALKKKGVIKTADNLPRGLVLMQTTSGPSENQIAKIPIVGTTAAGMPILSEEVYDGYVSLSKNLLGGKDVSNLYALRIHGDSMIEDGINDGDLAIIYKTKVAENGQIVAASIGDEENYGITLKHFYRMGDRYELRPANKNYDSMFSTHCDIHGKLVMIIRNY